LTVIVEGKEEYEVEKILNKRKVWEKDRFLVRWKGYTAEVDTWGGRENLGNAKSWLKSLRWSTVKGEKGVLDCNKQKVMGGGSPQLHAKGSEGRITKREVTERIKD